MVTSSVVSVSGPAAAAVTPDGCADVAELSTGFEPLYRVDLPRTGQGNATRPIPYTQRVTDDRPTFDRVAYCLETVSAVGKTKRAYASFDAFSSETADYEIPTRTKVIAQPVSNLTVQGDGVAPVTNASGGSVEFWAYAYSPASPNGDVNTFDFSDTPKYDDGYGSFQIHNTAAKQTVLAVNAWNRNERPLDIGIGNQPTGHPDWTFAQNGGSFRSATLTAYVRYADTAAVDCESGVGELSDYQLLYEAEVPATATPWLDGVDYSVDRRSELTGPISRVAYCLEGRNMRTPQWSYASMDAWTQNLNALRVPETDAAMIRRTVTNLTVRSSTMYGTAASIQADGAAGALEMWPNSYSPTAPPGGPAGASSTLWDFSDTPVQGKPSGYGSFQVHNLTSRQTVLALNGWSYPGMATALDVGIGNPPAGHPDSTWSYNRGQFNDLSLKVYVRPAGVTLTSGPIDHQLYPRDKATGAAMIPLTGTITDPAITGVRLVTKRNGVTLSTQNATGRSFTFSTAIRAELASYDQELWALRGSGTPTLIRSASDIVAGDVYVVQGQSNAVAALTYSPGVRSAADTSPWIRTFGSPAATPSDSLADRAWYHALGDTRDPMMSGMVGRVGLRLGANMIAQSGVPVAVIMGADGGKPSSFFQRNDAAPTDASTNYGRLLRRIQAAGLSAAVTSMVWYQGESDASAPTTHLTNVQALLGDWKTDFPSLTQTYMAQVRGCSPADALSAVQEIQRQLDARPDVTLMTTNGLENHDGCHYGYEGGYRQLADWFSLPMGRDLLGTVPAGPASSPKPSALSWANAGRTAIVVTMQDAAQVLTCDAAATADFRIEGATASVTAVTCGPGRITLTLSQSVPATATVSYLGHQGAVTSASAGMPDTAWITNTAGMGLIAFARQPIA